MLSMATSPVTIVTVFMMDPLVLGTRTGWPSDAPIPLCLCETPVSAIPRSGSIAGGMAPRLYVASGRSTVQMPVGQDQDHWKKICRVAPGVASNQSQNLNQIKDATRLRAERGVASCGGGS
jgi:hypothetical protein